MKPIEATNIATMASAEFVSLGAQGSSKRISWVRWRNQGEKDWRSRPPSGVTHPAQRLSTPDQTSRNTGGKKYFVVFLGDTGQLAVFLCHHQDRAKIPVRLTFLLRSSIFCVKGRDNVGMWNHTQKIGNRLGVKPILGIEAIQAKFKTLLHKVVWQHL